MNRQEKRQWWKERMNRNRQWLSKGLLKPGTKIKLCDSNSPAKLKYRLMHGTEQEIIEIDAEGEQITVGREHTSRSGIVKFRTCIISLAAIEEILN